jgi:hypothetical protein
MCDKLLFVYRRFIFQLIKVRMCFYKTDTKTYVSLSENKGTTNKLYLKFKLSFSKSRHLWFSPAMWWPSEHSPLLKRPLVDTEFDMPGLQGQK